MTSPLRRKRRITRQSFTRTSNGRSPSAPGSARFSRVCAAVAVLSLAVALPLRADDAVRLQWGNAPSR